MSTLTNRSQRIVTDSEDDVDPRQRRKRDLKMSTKPAASTPIDEEEKPKGKKRDYRHTHPIHTEGKPSLLSKEAPPENYSGFLRLGSECRLQWFGHVHGFIGLKQIRACGSLWLLYFRHSTNTITTAPLHHHVVLILAASNIRLMIENYVKYGLLLKIPGHDIPSRDYVLFVVAWISVPISLVVAFGVEWFMAQLAKRSKDDKPGKIPLVASEAIATTLHIVNLTFLMVYPSYIIYNKIYHPIVGSAMLLIALVLLLKLISYFLVNRDLRLLYVQNKTVTDYTIAYPDNITVSNLTYFWFAPTLCYQPSYPRTDHFRPIFFIKRVSELSIAAVTMYFLAEQYALPTLENSLKAMREVDMVVILERVLKLSTTAIIIWLLIFYSFFHSFLNALSEVSLEVWRSMDLLGIGRLARESVFNHLDVIYEHRTSRFLSHIFFSLLHQVLRFDDRTFYLAWWNSGTLASYWRLWNRPVYLFFKRHVYLPSVNVGIPPVLASVIVFFISAVMHEVLVGIPTHAITGFAFWGMLGQIPLIAVTVPMEKWRGKGSGLGNTIFWITFCVVGQPAIVLMYYYQWAINHPTIAESMGVVKNTTVSVA
ncbi:hypothetical protein BC936DRAFT_144796 [Jimgerdemannia flammicorona]|uniref:diacylglycerol O-acyltransferase n=1 Tax=Jimgerdemannia flammicorona TaxID=994334 RepID=A0A433DBL8_9FUNG|nr:hypothetical protein BC936DRAFT_144796 [Jimgerdemannia flammicorona]